MRKTGQKEIEAVLKLDGPARFDWRKYEPKEISLEALLDELLPKPKDREIRPGIFPTAGGKGVTPTVDELCKALLEEIERYE